MLPTPSIGPVGIICSFNNLCSLDERKSCSCSSACQSFPTRDSCWEATRGIGGNVGGSEETGDSLKVRDWAVRGGGKSKLKAGRVELS